ncbi:MAG: TIGR02266 family protein [Deltaproteobacteria bacterium]|nr:TIGR02266 family protein [Deltaproteobacteria bacterium]
MAAPREIVARYTRREDLLLDFRKKGPLGVLFVECGRKLTLGETVVVIVEFPHEKRSFRLRGRVISSRRGSIEPPLAPGGEVEFSYDQLQTMQLVLDFAEGKQISFVERRGRRLPCSFEIHYRSNDGFIKEFADDIGEGGSFIRSERLFPIGTLVECKLKPPGHLLGIKLQARVAWVKTTGEQRGMGVEFLFESERQRKKIREIVQRLASERARQATLRIQSFTERSRSEEP